MGQVSIGPNPVAQTSAILSQAETFAVEKWKHVINATMGFDTASFQILGNQSDLERLFMFGLAHDVKRYFREGGRFVVWEGFINELTLNLPGVSYTVSMADLANRVRVRYTALDTSVNPPVASGATTRTATASNTPSQNAFGIKDLVLSAGETTATLAAQIRDSALALYRRPRRRSDVSLGSNALSLDVKCLGYIHTLNWQVYNQTAVTGAQNASVEIGDILTGASQFIAARRISTNTNQIPKFTDFDRTALDLIQAIAQTADANGNRWLAQVLEDRTFYYKQASNEVRYTRRIADARQEITHAKNGVLVPYELIRPDCYLRTLDVGVGQSFGDSPARLQDDMQLMYIEQVEFSEPDGLRLLGSLGDTVQNRIAYLAAQGKTSL